jgi:hypothetical protein
VGGGEAVYVPGVCGGVCGTVALRWFCFGLLVFVLSLVRFLVNCWFFKLAYGFFLCVCWLVVLWFITYLFLAVCGA